MNNKKKLMVAASIAGLMAASATSAFAGSAFPGHDAGNKSHCDMNGCKGRGMMDHSCGGKNACKGHQNGCKGAAGTAAAVDNGTLAEK